MAKSSTRRVNIYINNKEVKAPSYFEFFVSSPPPKPLPMNRCRPYRFVHPLRGCVNTRGNAIGYRYASPNGDEWRNLHLGARHVSATTPPRWEDYRHTVFTAPPPQCADATTTLHSPFSILNSSFSHTFSAKERDTETGLSYFGARYYSSDLSIWLSVDPMSDKYPSLSPYVYCADNPVKLVDPNGEDYEVVVDEKNKTITIHADFYVSKSDCRVLEEGLKHWNNANGKYFYTTGEGSDATTYQVLLIMNAIPCGSISEVETRSMDNICGNQFSIEDNISINNIDYRGTYNDGVIKVSNDFSLGELIRSSAHEPGHAIGIGDISDGGLMQSGGNSVDIHANYIASALMYAGFDFKEPENLTSPKSPCKVSVKGKIPNGKGTITEH